MSIRNIFLALTAILGLSGMTKAISQCPLNSIYIANTQGAIDSFEVLYPTCQRIGQLQIIGPGVQSFEGIGILDSIGTLVLVESSLENLEDFSSKNIGGISLSDNPLLERCDFSAVFGSFLVFAEDNPRLRIIDCSSVEKFASIFLESDSLTLIVGTAEANDLYLIGDIGVTSEEPLKVHHNIGLVGSTKYKSFDVISKDMIYDDVNDLTIGRIDSFNTFGYQPMVLRGSFGLIDIPTFVTSPEDIQPSEVEDLRIFRMGDLSDLSFFSEFETNQVHLRDNPSLERLSGLENSAGHLTRVELLRNESLSDISTLEMLTPSIERLTIEDNPLLTYCHYAPICEKVAADGDNPFVVVEGNAGDCIDEPTLLQACMTSSVDEEGSKELVFYPNPVADILFASEYVSPMAVYDGMGRLVHTYDKTVSKNMDVSMLKSGVYLLTYQLSTGSVEFSRFLKR